MQPIGGINTKFRNGRSLVSGKHQQDEYIEAKKKQQLMISQSLCSIVNAKNIIERTKGIL